MHSGADSIGLLRSEFLFLDRGEPPDEDEQVTTYLAIIDALGGRRLTIRTLDVGGDKPVPYLPARTGRTRSSAGEASASASNTRAVQPQLRALMRVGQDNPVTCDVPDGEHDRRAAAIEGAARRRSRRVGCRRASCRSASRSA